MDGDEYIYYPRPERADLLLLFSKKEGFFSLPVVSDPIRSDG